MNIEDLESARVDFLFAELIVRTALESDLAERFAADRGAVLTEFGIPSQYDASARTGRLVVEDLGGPSVATLFCCGTTCLVPQLPRVR
jgi:hypothetical protein